MRPSGEWGWVYHRRGLRHGLTSVSVLRLGTAHGWGGIMTVPPYCALGTCVLRIMFDGSPNVLCCTSGWPCYCLEGRPRRAMLHGWVALCLCLHAGPSVPWVAIGPWSLALGVPLVPWCPPVPCSLASGLGPGPGLFVAAGASFLVWRRVCSAHVACKTISCVLMLYLGPRVCVAHAGIHS